MAKFKSSMMDLKSSKQVPLRGALAGPKKIRSGKVKLGKSIPAGKAKTVPSFTPKLKLPGPGGTY